MRIEIVEDLSNFVRDINCTQMCKYVNYVNYIALIVNRCNDEYRTVGALCAHVLLSFLLSCARYRCTYQPRIIV